LIAGAGAIGSTCAYVLAKAGYAVAVIDPAPPGDNASGVAAGMLAPAFESLFDAASHGRYQLFARARDLWPGLAQDIGLTIARDGAAAVGPNAEATVQALRALGAEASLIRGPGGRPAAFSPEDWRLDPAEALAALRRGAERFGAHFEAGRVSGPTPGRRLVIATGAGQDLAAHAPELARLAPIKGHILRADGDFGAGPVLRADGAYLCATQRGAILGATMEPGVTDPVIDPAAVRRLIDSARDLGDWVAAAHWRAAAGVRASTPDGLPLVGFSQAPGVVLAVGARRNGWLLAPMIANAVLDALRGRENVQTALFDPARFSRG
jgi:glycine oxidase